MTDPLDGVRLKLKRAVQQLDSLKVEIDAYRDRKPYVLPSYFDADQRNFWVGVIFRERPDPRWGVQIGEIVYNLRSALDQVAWRLVILETGKPPANTKTGFPIFETRGGTRVTGGSGFSFMVLAGTQAH